MLFHSLSTILTSMRHLHYGETLDVPVSLTQEKIPERIAEEVFDVLASPVMKDISEILKFTPQEQASKCIGEMIAGIPVPKVTEATVEVVPLMSQEQNQEHIVELIDALFPQGMEEMTIVVKIIPRERDRMALRTTSLDLPAPVIQDELVEVVQDMMTQKPVPAAQVVQKKVKDPNAQLADTVTDITVIQQRLTVQTAQKTTEVPQVPVVTHGRCALLALLC